MPSSAHRVNIWLIDCCLATNTTLLPDQGCPVESRLEMASKKGRKPNELTSSWLCLGADGELQYHRSTCAPTK